MSEAKRHSLTAVALLSAALTLGFIAGSMIAPDRAWAHECTADAECEFPPSEEICEPRSGFECLPDGGLSGGDCDSGPCEDPCSAPEGPCQV